MAMEVAGAVAVTRITVRSLTLELSFLLYGTFLIIDCGGTCGGGCAHGPCNTAPLIETSGCHSGDCGSSRHSSSSSSSSSSGYHRTVTTLVKENREDSLKIIVGQPSTVHRAAYVESQPIIRKTTYIEPQPIIRKTTYIQQAPVVIKKHRYIDEGDYAASGCAGPCGGSKIVKIIKKTTYAGDGGE